MLWNLFYFLQQSQGPGGRGRVVFSIETAAKFRSILDDFVAEYKSLADSSSNLDSERLKTWDDNVHVYCITMVILAVRHLTKVAVDITLTSDRIQEAGLWSWLC